MKSGLSPADAPTAQLEARARKIREHVLRMSSEAKAPHVGSALSCVEILTALYFQVAKVDPRFPEDPKRDRILFSKGHASAALYACLAEKGYFPPSELRSYCATGSAFAEHPSRGKVPGVEVSTGSLGHGLGLGIGIALGGGLQGHEFDVYVVLSDGECNEGSVWEAALWAPAHDLGNVVAIVDFNKLQATGDSRQITRLEPLGKKWEAFGWDAVEIDGHDAKQLVSALTNRTTGHPRAIVAHTVKGKGVSFMEGNLEWHYRPPSPDDLERALKEIWD